LGGRPGANQGGPAATPPNGEQPVENSNSGASFLETVEGLVQEDQPKAPLTVNPQEPEALFEDLGADKPMDPALLAPQAEETLLVDASLNQEALPQPSTNAATLEIDPAQELSTALVDPNRVDGVDLADATMGDENITPDDIAMEALEVNGKEATPTLDRESAQQAGPLPATTDLQSTAPETAVETVNPLPDTDHHDVTKLKARQTSGQESMPATTAAPAASETAGKGAPILADGEQAEVMPEKGKPVVSAYTRNGSRDTGQQANHGRFGQHWEHLTAESKPMADDHVPSKAATAEGQKTFMGAKVDQPVESRLAADPLPDAKGNASNEWSAMEQERAPKIASSAEAKEAGKLSKPIQTGIVQQIVERAQLQKIKDQPEIKIKLKPAFLGNLRMNISTENQQVSVKIIAQTPVVKEALETNLNQLKTELASQGLEIDSFDVSVEKDTEHFNSKNQQTLARRSRNSNSNEAFNMGEEAADLETEELASDDPLLNPGGISYFA
jgi:flagellar hook-length control protein FliK